VLVGYVVVVDGCVCCCDHCTRCLLFTTLRLVGLLRCGCCVRFTVYCTVGTLVGCLRYYPRWLPLPRSFDGCLVTVPCCCGPTLPLPLPLPVTVALLLGYCVLLRLLLLLVLLLTGYVWSLFVDARICYRYGVVVDSCCYDFAVVVTTRLLRYGCYCCGLLRSLFLLVLLFGCCCCGVTVVRLIYHRLRLHVVAGLTFVVGCYVCYVR